MPMSFMRANRGSGSKNASMPGMARTFREAHLRITGCGLAVTLGDVTAVASRHSNLPERGVGDVLADLVPDGELGAAMDIDVLDNSLVLPGDELGESVPVLVEVVVGVEGRVGEASLPNVDEFLAGFAHC